MQSEFQRRDVAWCGAPGREPPFGRVQAGGQAALQASAWVQATTRLSWKAFSKKIPCAVFGSIWGVIHTSQVLCFPIV